MHSLESFLLIKSYLTSNLQAYCSLQVIKNTYIK